MSNLGEREIIDRHCQALGEAHRACQELGRNADPDHIALKGGHYVALKAALDMLEGSARQMAHYRSDARWLKLGIHYAKVMRAVQVKFVGQRWAFFNQLMQLFTEGRRHMDDLATVKTGRIGAILPERPSDFLILPDWRPAMPRGVTVH